MTSYMKRKLDKLKWKYQLHDEFGCLREFRTKEDAIQWKNARQELKLVIIKPPKINYKNLEKFEDLYDIPF